MEFGIEGLKNSRVIHYVEKLKNNDGTKIIKIHYLKGSSDIIEFTEENYQRVILLMSLQGKQFISNDRKKEEKLKDNMKLAFSVYILLLIGLIFGRLNIGVSFLYIGIPIGILLSVSSFCFEFYSYNKLQALKKYHLYFSEIENKLTEYKKIVQKENTLQKCKNINSDRLSKFNGISDLDTYSLKDLIEIKEKIERYSSLIGETNERCLLPDVVQDSANKKTKILKKR